MVILDFQFSNIANGPVQEMLLVFLFLQHYQRTSINTLYPYNWRRGEESGERGKEVERREEVGEREKKWREGSGRGGEEGRRERVRKL